MIPSALIVPALLHKTTMRHDHNISNTTKSIAMGGVVRIATKRPKQMLSECECPCQFENCEAAGGCTFRLAAQAAQQQAQQAQQAVAQTQQYVAQQPLQVNTSNHLVPAMCLYVVVSAASDS